MLAGVLMAAVKSRAQAMREASPEVRRRFRALSLQAQIMFERTGIRHNVDHIVPIALGGAHHPDNMRVIPEAENRRKGARPPHPWELVDIFS